MESGGSGVWEEKITGETFEEECLLDVFLAEVCICWLYP